MKDFRMSKNDFFNVMEKDYPQAMVMFGKWIDDFKEKIDWKNIFPMETSINAEGILEGKSTKKFHDLNFYLQDGIMRLFFMQNGLFPSTFPHQKRGFTWQIIIEETNELAFSFLDSTATDVTSFAESFMSDIDCYRVCFSIIEERLTLRNS